ncbi:MAG: patatin-like phospholipase family protein [Acidimicrobiales bacterium]
MATAFVLGGGGVLGAAEVGMLQALFERDVMPDLIVGSSVGALNGVVVAAEPSAAAVERLAATWAHLQGEDLFAGSMVGRLSTLARHRTHLHSNEGLRRLIDDAVPGARIEDLPVTFQCVAASIEKAAAHWFDSGPVLDAVMASCSVPGLLPPVRIGDEHFVDGGLIRSVPIGRAVELGAQRVFVLHVGRIERPLRPPRWPWDVALVAFEISRRHQFSDDLARIPEGVEVHILPTGIDVAPLASIRYRDSSAVPKRIEAAHRATLSYLDRLGQAGHLGHRAHFEHFEG